MSTPTFQQEKNASWFNSICNSNIDQKNFEWFIMLSVARQFASTYTIIICSCLNHFYMCVPYNESSFENYEEKNVKVNRKKNVKHKFFVQLRVN